MSQSVLPSSSLPPQLTSAFKDFPSKHLLEGPLFRNRAQDVTLPTHTRVALSYMRAKAILSAYNLTITDISILSHRFWDLHSDPIWTLDGAASTLATIHVNLVMGTLVKYSHQKRVRDVLSKMERFEVNGQYCLTELGHGLDAFSLETRADMAPEGGFILNTPAPQAAKFMPPTTPCGIPVTAIVFARLFVQGCDHGIKPFLVPLHDGYHMYSGISSTPLTLRGSSTPVIHALTSFRRVLLPSTALLSDTSRARDQTTAFFEHIDRVIVGTLLMGRLAVTALSTSAAIASMYSRRRHVSDPVSRKPIPIISIPTQAAPVVTAVAQAHVLRVFGDAARKVFVDSKDQAERHFIAAVWKVTAARMSMSSTQLHIDRCGAQGLFEVNQMTTILADLRGAAIAEGDIQVIAIRFAADLLLGRVSAPDQADPSSLLARHETGVMDEMLGVLAKLKHPRREMASVVLPQATRIIESIGHRMAVEAAHQAGLHAKLIKLFEANSMKTDPAWYVEHGVSRIEQDKMERDAVQAAAPELEIFVRELNVEAYIQAPIVSDEKWDAYVAGLQSFDGEDNVTSSIRGSEGWVVARL